MSNIITVENTEMQIREYNGERVVTFDDICKAHKCERKRLTRHFERKRKYFIKDEDYYQLTRKELGDLTSPKEKIVGNPNLKTYLFTESGYLMVIKCLDDDIAWQVQRQLVNTYFKAKEEAVQLLLSEEPEPKYKTSDTKIRLNPVWYERNRRTIEHICRSANLPKKTLYHEILVYLGEQYDLDYANYLYQNETGNPPKYPMDIVNYFTQLGEEADGYLKRLETKMRELNYM